MIRKITSSKTSMMVIMFVALLAVWKINNGNLTSVADGVWGVFNEVSDQIVNVWDHFTSGKKGS